MKKLMDALSASDNAYILKIYLKFKRVLFMSFSEKSLKKKISTIKDKMTVSRVTCLLFRSIMDFVKGFPFN